MKTDRIDFIDAYCDRWCERCAFTMRCAGFDRHVAVAMCDGDLEQAFELALSRPDPVRVEGAEPPAWRKELEENLPDHKELAEIGRQLAARERRVDETRLSQSSHDYSMAAHRWFTAHQDHVEAVGDAVVREALEVARWDSTLLSAKLHRALSGREDARDGDGSDEGPIQSDWNGSAKVALISLERSEAAWRTLAAATSDSGAMALAGQAADLRRLALAEFPRAMEFIRPGFDEPWR